MIKIELGSGEYPREGYYHADIRFGLEDLDIQMDILNLPFRENSIDEFFTVNTMEHIGWNHVARVLKDLFNCLKPGGSFRCYTPDLKNLCRWLLAGKIEITTLLSWFYGGGQYAENWHRGGFTKEYMSQLLLRTGFTITTIQDDEGLWTEAQKPST